MSIVTTTQFGNNLFEFHVNEDGTYNIMKKDLLNGSVSVFEENLHKLLATLAFKSLSKGEPIQREV